MTVYPEDIDDESLTTDYKIEITTTEKVLFAGVIIVMAGFMGMLVWGLMSDDVVMLTT